MNLKVVESAVHFRNRFIEFNTRLYANRLTSLQQAIFKWELQNFDYKYVHFLALDDENIVGQIVLLPYKCFYNNQKFDCVFAYDYIVDPAYLNTGVGVKLLAKTLKSHIHFGMGVSNISKKLHLILKEKTIGNVYKYLYTKNLMALVFAGVKTYLKWNVRKLPSMLHWPQSFQSNGLIAKISETAPYQQHAWNNDVIEFGRAKEFVDIRFNKFPSKYVYYQIFDQQEKLRGYFVCRVEIWRGMRVLIVSDYRFVIGDGDVLNCILFVSKKLMQQNKMDAILFGSSIQWIDETVQKNKFKKVGVPSEILTNLSLDTNWEQKAAKRDLIFVTPADSDFEFNLGNELWIK